MDEKAVSVQSMFGRLAQRYDLANDLISFGQHRWWKRKAVGLAQVPVGGVALDLCTGTGDLAFWLAERAGPEGEVVGVDFCSPMLAIADRRYRKLSPSGLARVQFVQAAAERLPLPDSQFDGCTVAFGLRNVSDLHASLMELHRVLKPGGRLVSLDVSTPDSPLFGRLYPFYFNRVLPLIGAAANTSRTDYSYLPSSAARFPQKQEMCRRMLDAGYASVGFYTLSGGAVAIHVAEKAGPEQGRR